MRHLQLYAMNLPTEITLDALQFADPNTRLAMLLVNRLLFRIVDGNRKSLALPEVCGRTRPLTVPGKCFQVWIEPALWVFLKAVMVIGSISLSAFTFGKSFCQTM